MVESRKSSKNRKKESSEKKKEEEKEEKEEKDISLKDLLCLKNIKLNINKGEFVCIIGDVGAGKSSLLSAILGELHYLNQNTVRNYGEDML